jgi:hypothetical protein
MPGKTSGKSVFQDVTRTWLDFKQTLPIMAGVLLLVELVNTAASPHYKDLFTNHWFWDSLIGALSGSLSFGIPKCKNSFYTGYGFLLWPGLHRNYLNSDNNFLDFKRLASQLDNIT